MFEKDGKKGKAEGAEYGCRKPESGGAENKKTLQKYRKRGGEGTQVIRKRRK